MKLVVTIRFGCSFLRVRAHVTQGFKKCLSLLVRRMQTGTCDTMTQLRDVWLDRD